ncbi:MAG: RNA polymerase sigma factor [Deltaproteobacteria bacterium]|nr:RNA polymerase sigma factor [Deltaproteobacteria bacterium]
MASLKIVRSEAEPPGPEGSEASDADVLALARGGDRAALKALYEREKRAVFRFLFDLLGDAPEATEGMQETFRRAFQSLASLGDGHLRAWLFGIARNVYLEHRRSRRREALHEALDEERGYSDPDAPTPEVLFLRHEAAAVMRRALGALSEDRRTVLLLRIDHGLSYLQIAELMDWSMAKVKVEIHRARQRLREEMVGPGDKP